MLRLLRLLRLLTRARSLHFPIWRFASQVVAFKFIAQVKKAKFPEKEGAGATFPTPPPTSPTPPPARHGANPRAAALVGSPGVSPMAGGANRCDAQTQSFLKVPPPLSAVRFGFCQRARAPLLTPWVEKRGRVGLLLGARVAAGGFGSIQQLPP
jgi:hypothetical protein